MGSCVTAMVKSYFKIFLDVDNPDGDEIAFETNDKKITKMIIDLMTSKCKSVNPE